MQRELNLDLWPPASVSKRITLLGCMPDVGFALFMARQIHFGLNRLKVSHSRTRITLIKRDLIKLLQWFSA